MTLDWWTLAIQSVNVLILVWLLGHFFWRPVAAMIEERRAAAAQTLADAEAKRREAAVALAEIERTRAAFAAEHDAIVAAAQETAEKERSARLEEAAHAAAALETAAKAAIAKDQEAAEKAWTERASHLAIAIAQRLAARLDGAAVRAVFLDWLLREIRGLPEAARQAVAADDVTLEAISAAPLDPTEEERTRKLITEAFAANPTIAFKVEPALIAGLELHGPHLAVANSWRADLTQILADLAHDSRS